MEALASQYGFKLLDRLEAVTWQLMGGDIDAAASVLLYNNSFSAVLQKVHKVTGQTQEMKGVYIDEEEGNGEDCQYFVGLHETGHMVLGHQKKLEERQKQGVSKLAEARSTVADEMEAWEWAWYNAKHEPSDETICHMLTSLSTYTDKLVELERDLGVDKL